VPLSAACGDDDGDDDDDVVADAAIGTPDALICPDAGPVPDAGPAPDAGPTPDAATACATDLGVQDDGSTGGADTIPDLVISELNPGDYLEVFNPTGSTVDISMTPYSAYRWCAPFQYAPLAPTISIPAGSYAVLDWPASFSNATDAGGEVILYRSSAFGTSSDILDFVCWGTYGSSRKTQAESVAKWSGACVSGAIPAGGALHRNTGATGTTAADYTASASISPMTCTAE